VPAQGPGGRHAHRLAELLGVLEHGLVQEHGHGVVIQGIGFATQAQRLERYGASAGKGVQNPGRSSGIRLPDEGAGLFQEGLVQRLLPGCQLLDEREKLVSPGRVVGQEGGQGGGTRGRQRPPRPPDVQPGNVPVADVLLAH